MLYCFISDGPRCGDATGNGCGRMGNGGGTALGAGAASHWLRPRHTGAYVQPVRLSQSPSRSQSRIQGEARIPSKGCNCCLISSVNNSSGFQAIAVKGPQPSLRVVLQSLSVRWWWAERAPEPLGKAMARILTFQDVILPQTGQYIQSRGCMSYTAPYPHGVPLQVLPRGCVLGPICEVLCTPRFSAVRIGDAWINIAGRKYNRCTTFASLIPQRTSDTWRDGSQVLVNPCNGTLYMFRRSGCSVENLHRSASEDAGPRGSDVASAGSSGDTQPTLWATVAASEATEDGHEASGEQCNESSISSEEIGAAALGNVCLGNSPSCVSCRRNGPHRHLRARSVPCLGNSPSCMHPRARSWPPAAQ